jgi:hypothetical protein
MRGSAVRVLVAALVVLGLLGLVTIAATGSTSAGSDESRRAPYFLFDTAVGLALVAILAVVALLVYAFAHKTPTHFERTRGDLAAIVAILSFAVLIGTSDVPTWLQSRLSAAEEQREVGAPGENPTYDTGPPDRPAFSWLPLAVIVSLVGIVITARVLAERRRRAARLRRDEVHEDVVEVLEEALGDIRAEKDPRRAVIAAYAQLERVLAAHGLARVASETQEEYLTRILDQLDVDVRSIRRLTDLFAVAKFSQHLVDAEMREEAIETFEHLRDELRASALHHGDMPGTSLAAGPS